jgi:acyl carrier protein
MENRMTNRSEIYEAVAAQIAPFNKKGADLTETTTFQGDLEWDSLTVMNMQAEIESVGELVDAVAKLLTK